jgi:hypothetical protein
VCDWQTDRFSSQAARTVASGPAEEMAASLREISQQASLSSAIVERTVGEVGHTATRVDELSAAAAAAAVECKDVGEGGFAMSSPDLKDSLPHRRKPCLSAQRRDRSAIRIV